MGNSKVRIELIAYDKEQLIEKQDVSIDEKIDPSLVSWLNIHGVKDGEMIQKIASHFKLHPLIVEDIMTEQRSKLDDYKENIFLIVYLLKLNKETQEIYSEQLSVVLGKNYVLTFVKNDPDTFEPIRNRLRKSDSRIRSQGADYLTYSIIDLIVDHYFEILEQVDQQLEGLEGKLINKPSSNTLLKIQRTKRKISHLRKAVWPMREVISHFRRLESPLIQESTKLYIQDVYDHTIQTIDTIENFRDIVAGMFDIYLSNINLRMNEIMKVLTIVATIFVPLSFIADVYGMNFDFIPGLHSKWGYYICLFTMLFVAIGMLIFFRKRKWI